MTFNIWNDNTTANQIDKIWESKSEQQHRAHIAKTIDKYLPENITLLDAGCGSGEVYKHIKPYLDNKNCNYFGIDGSIPFIDLCRKRYYNDLQIVVSDTWMEQQKVRFELQNLFGTIFSDKTFDFTICIDVIQHVAYYESILKELFRITKKKLLFRTWVSTEPDKIVFEGDVNNNVYNEDALINYCKLISAGKFERLEKGLYIISK